MSELKIIVDEVTKIAPCSARLGRWYAAREHGDLNKTCRWNASYTVNGKLFCAHHGAVYAFEIIKNWNQKQKKNG